MSHIFSLDRFWTIKWRRFCFIPSSFCCCFLMNSYYIFLNGSNSLAFIFYTLLKIFLCGKGIHEIIHHFLRDFRACLLCFFYIEFSFFLLIWERHLFWLIDHSWIWRQSRKRIKASFFNHDLSSISILFRKGSTVTISLSHN